MSKTKTSKQSSVTKKLNLVPTAGYILIAPLEVQKQTASGIYLPDNANSEKAQKGTVLAVGDDEIVDDDLTRKSPAKVGEVVIYKKWGGSEVKIDGVEYLFAKFEDILAIEK